MKTKLNEKLRVNGPHRSNEDQSC